MTPETSGPDFGLPGGPSSGPAPASPFLLRWEGAAVVITLTDRSIFGTSRLESLQKELHQATRGDPAAFFVLDLTRVEFISSGFLGMLLKFSQRLRATGSPLRLCNLHPGLAEVLRAGKLERHFDIRVDLEDALSQI